MCSVTGPTNHPGNDPDQLLWHLHVQHYKALAMRFPPDQKRNLNPRRRATRHPRPCRITSGALSPLPTVFSILFVGALLTYTILLSFLRAQRSSISSFSAQAYLFLALVTLACSFFTAILFQASSTINYAVFSISSDLAARKSVAGLAVAWAAMFFTCLAVAGAAFLVVSATQDPEEMRQRAHTHREDVWTW